MPAHALKVPNAAPKWCQNIAKTPQIEPRWGPGGPKWSQNEAKMGSRRRKNQRKTPTRQKRGLDLAASPLLSRKNGQHGPNLGVKMEPGWPKNPFKNRLCFRCILESVFERRLLFFGYQNGATLIPKWDPKLISSLDAEKQLKASRLAFSWLSGVKVGSKNRPQIDPKMESKLECILVSIFNYFG